MNTRIQELSEQAHTFASETQGRCEDNPDYDAAFESKFAELIVKECADAADMAFNARCSYPGDYVVEQMGFGEEQGATEWRIGVK